MKYLRATFKGYIGFYSGLGLDTVDIDFTRSTHSIILIVGANGCGKSTLINALNIFPDSSSNFIKGKDASKNLILQDENNIYNIYIVSPADDKGGRKTTKAYIQKNGLELNENGNVSTYKDIISTEFELDSNFASLTSLSSNDRGLGDKTPAERKKFAANIIDNLEIYNNIYKNLNKKSLIYKSHINTLHTKIQNIGRKEDLENQLLNLKNKEKNYNDKIIELNNNIVSIQAKTSMDEEELQKINNATSKVEGLNNIISNLESDIRVYANKTKIDPENIENKLNESTRLLDNYTNTLNNIKVEWKSKYDRLNSVNDSLNNIKAEMSEFNLNSDIETRYNKSNEILKIAKKEINSEYLNNLENTIYDLNTLVKLYNNVIVMIDDFYDNLDEDSARLICTSYNVNTRNSILSNQQNISKEISNTEVELESLRSKLKILNVLDDRPTKCKIDTCIFIKEALDIKKSYKGNIEDDLFALQEKLNNLSKKYAEVSQELAIYDSLLHKYTKYQSISNLILDNKIIIEKYNKEFMDNFNIRLSEMNLFNDIRDNQNIIDLMNALKIYSNEVDNNKILEVEYKAYEEKLQIINSNKVLFDKLESEEKELSTDISKLKSDMDNYQDLIDTINKQIPIEKEYSILLEKIKEPMLERDKYQSIVDEAQHKSAKAIESINIIQEYKNQINQLSSELEPIMNQINLISGQLTLLDSYYNEYNEYKRSYDIIETVKKYCSPTGGGIQTLFMQLYMSKTLEIANNVLGMLFSGEYRLLDFVINEHEFRIPFIGSGLPVDDISSGSSSQISIIGMIINLTLLHQASTKFNIARLDEIDAGLDSKNRSDFVNFIFYAMNILNIEQVFMISHSIEADNSNADIIKLRMYDDYEGGIQSGNIIYDYNEFTM